MSEQSDAAKRAAARKAKILARGNAGLNKLAQTARGEEAEKLYGGGGEASTSRPATPSTPAAAAARPRQPGPNINLRQVPPEQQAMNDQLQAMLSMLSGGGGPGGAAPAGMPDMSQLLSQMMGAGAGADGDLPSDRLLGDLDNPAGFGGAGAGGFPDFSALGGAGAGGGNGGLPPGFPDLSALGGGFPGMVPKQKSWIEKVFPLIHVLSVLALLGFIVGWWEPAAASKRIGLDFGGGIWRKRWGRLGASGWKSGLWHGGVEVLPVFWAFTTIELILQTTRFIVLKSPPRPHSLISTFLPLLPPNLARPILTASRYFSLLSQMWKDACLLVFGIGLTVIFANQLSTA